MEKKILVSIGAFALLGILLLRKKTYAKLKQTQLPIKKISSTDIIPNGGLDLPNNMDLPNLTPVAKDGLSTEEALNNSNVKTIIKDPYLINSPTETPRPPRPIEEEEPLKKSIEDTMLAEIAKLKLIEDTRLLEGARLRARELQEQQYRTQQEANQLRYYQEIAKAKEIEMAELKATEDARLRGAEQERLKQIEDARLAQILIANAIQKLRDEIIANINRRNGYKTQGSKNAVQADINVQLNRLKEYGYSLDSSNNLIEVMNETTNNDVDIPNGTSIIVPDPIDVIPQKPVYFPIKENPIRRDDYIYGYEPRYSEEAI